MIQTDREMRARVVKREGDLATLGVFVDGVWARVQARTEVDLQPGWWIRGMFSIHRDGETIFFRVLSVENGASTQTTPPTSPSSPGGIDLQA